MTLKSTKAPRLQEPYFIHFFSTITTSFAIFFFSGIFGQR
jgi:hypothetical protein